MHIEEKLDGWQRYVEEYTKSRDIDEEPLSGRRRLAGLLIGLGLALDPDAAERLAGPGNAIVAAAH
jgi:hypothetical protein